MKFVDIDNYELSSSRNFARKFVTKGAELLPKYCDFNKCDFDHIIQYGSFLNPFSSLQNILKSMQIHVEIHPGIFPVPVPDHIQDTIRRLREDINIAEANGDYGRMEKLQDEYSKRYEGWGNMLMLGKYVHEDKLIVLYPEAMKASDSNKVVEFFQTTFVHEVMHAYFSRDSIREKLPYVCEIEEPLAEFGMLFFLKEIGFPVYDWVYNSVAAKKCCYADGVLLMDQCQKEIAQNTGDLPTLKFFKNYKCFIPCASVHRDGTCQVMQNGCN